MAAVGVPNAAAAVAAGQASVVHLTKVFVPKMVMGGGERGEATAQGKGQEVYMVRFSPDGQLVAASMGDGSIKVYSAMSGKLAYHLNQNKGEIIPTMCVRFRPNSAGSTRNVLIAGTASGLIQHWHVTSGKNLGEILEEDNRVYALDYSPDGTKFASGGNDATVRVYDEATRKCVVNLHGGSGKSDATGHSNRVFSVKFAQDHPNVLLTGGWDDTVLVWDVRQELPVRVIFGPHICGDAIDTKGDLVLTGAWRPDNPVQMWDLGSTELLYDVPFPTNPGEPCLVYTAQFSKDKAASRIIAGGSGTNEARIYERESQIPTVIGSIKGMQKGVFSTDFHPGMNQVAVGSGDGTVRIIEYP